MPLKAPDPPAQKAVCLSVSSYAFSAAGPQDWLPEGTPCSEAGEESTDLSLFKDLSILKVSAALSDLEEM